MTRCMVLNADYGFLQVEDHWIDALCLTLSGKAVAIEHYPETVRSERAQFQLPAVVVMNRQVRTGRRRSLFEGAGRKVVFTRDGFTCQYCGCRVTMASGTKDHVMPRSRKGPDTLANVVTACGPCNARKADRTPEEAGMTLRRTPRALTEIEKIQCLLKTVRSRERATWMDCLDRHGIRLWMPRA